MSESYKIFLENRKNVLHKIFTKKSLLWIDENISYHYFNRINIINEHKFKNVIGALNKSLSDKEILWLMYIIEYSYIPVEVIIDFFPNVITPSISMEKRDLVKYYIFQQNNNIFVSFRGTKTLWETINSLKFYRVNFDLFTISEKKEFINWRNDIIKTNSFEPTRTPLLDDLDIEIHKGFLDEANLIYKDVVEKISQIINPTCKKTNIVLCGHSLGGVLASIVGIYLAYYLKKAVELDKFVINIVTANTPPCGNKNFNLLIPYLKIRNYVRIYNYQDFVPYYGYFGSWIESKKFRHIDFMLKEGIEGEINKEGRIIKQKIGKTKIDVRDYGKNLDIFLKKINLDKESLINLKYIYHDFFSIIKKNKVLFI